MASVISILIVAAVSLIIVRVGAMALEMTGLSRDSSHFQAVSAFFGAGFTTGESEMVVNHPVRRRVIRDLIVVGQVGVTTVLAASVIAFLQFRGLTTLQSLERIGVIVGGVFVIWGLSKTRVVMRLVDASIRRALLRIGFVRAMDYERVLGLAAGYGVSELGVEVGDPLAGKTLREAALREHGVLVLGVLRDGQGYIGAPTAATQILAGDTLVLYGPDKAVRALSRERPAELPFAPPDTPSPGPA